MRRDLIIYQLEEPESADDKLTMVEYIYNPVFGRKKILGFPKFMYIKDEDVKNQPPETFKKKIILNDIENKLYENDFDKIEIFQQPEPKSVKYSLTAFFKREERLYLGSSFVDRDLNTSADKYNLRDCFEQMGKPEILEDGWKCGNCHSNKGAEKKEYLTDTNSILIISLKRFQMNGNKIKNMIEYPVTHLNIGEWLQESDNRMGNRYYDLYAVCLHQGTMEYGHYRAYCKHFVSGKWYEFDDEKVNQIDEENIVTPNAYMLFYKLR